VGISLLALIAECGILVLRYAAFTGYLGEDKEAWKEYDATELVKAHTGPAPPVLIDVGTQDEFLESQLHPWAFAEAAKGKIDVTLNMQDGYDHRCAAFRLCGPSCVVYVIYALRAVNSLVQIDLLLCAVTSS
jgi:hypothetical protein